MEAGTTPLKCVPCIHYPVHFKKSQNEIQALIDSGSGVNAMTPAYAAKLGLQVRSSNLGVQKINGSTLVTHGMLLASFQVEDKHGIA